MRKIKDNILFAYRVTKQRNNYKEKKVPLKAVPWQNP